MMDSVGPDEIPLLLRIVAAHTQPDGLVINLKLLVNIFVKKKLELRQI